MVVPSTFLQLDLELNLSPAPWLAKQNPHLRYSGDHEGFLIFFQVEWPQKLDCSPLILETLPSQAGTLNFYATLTLMKALDRFWLTVQVLHSWCASWPKVRHTAHGSATKYGGIP